MARFKIGCHTLTWGNYHKDYSLGNALWDIKQAGYEGVEIFDPLNRLGTVEALKNRLSEIGLQLASLSANIRVTGDEKQDLISAREKAEFASAFGVKALMTTGGWTGDGLKKSAGGYRSLGRRLDSLAKSARRFDIDIAFHNHLDTIIEEEKDILNLLEFSKSVKLCIDTGHLAAVGSDPVAAIKRFAASVVLVHLKDWDPRAKDFVELGRGVLCHKIKDVLEVLENINFTGWIVVELDMTSKTPFESARISREFLGGMGY